MMGLTRRQQDMLDFIVREQSAGRAPSLASAARVLRLRSRSSAHALRRLIDQRLGRARVDAIVPRGPSGERLIFFPIGDRP